MKVKTRLDEDSARIGHRTHSEVASKSELKVGIGYAANLWATRWAL